MRKNWLKVITISLMVFFERGGEAGYVPTPNKPELVVVGRLENVGAANPNQPGDRMAKGILTIQEVLQGTPRKQPVELLFVKTGIPGRSDGDIFHGYREGQEGVWMLTWDPMERRYRPAGYGKHGVRSLQEIPEVKKAMLESPGEIVRLKTEQSVQTVRAVKIGDLGLRWAREGKPLLVASVVPSSAAAEAKIEKEDTLLRVEQYPVATRREFEDRIYQYAVGSLLKIHGMRKGAAKEFQLRLPIFSEPPKEALTVDQGITMLNGQPYTGTQTSYFPGGTVSGQAEFENGVRVRWRSWYENGELASEQEFEHGKMVNQTYWPFKNP